MLRPQPCTIAQKNRVHRTVIFNQYICDKFHPTFRHDSCAPLVPNPPFQNNPTVRKCNKTTIPSNFMTSFLHTDWVCPPRQLCETPPIQNRRFQCHKHVQKLGWVDEMCLVVQVWLGNCEAEHNVSQPAHPDNLLTPLPFKVIVSSATNARRN